MADFCDIPPLGSVYLNDRYYYAATNDTVEDVSWLDANVFCKSIGMVLASVNTTANVNAVKNLVDRK